MPCTVHTTFGGAYLTARGARRGCGQTAIATGSLRRDVETVATAAAGSATPLRLRPPLPALAGVARTLRTQARGT